MKKMVIVIVAMFFTVCLGSAALAADTKVGVINIMQAVNESAAGKKAIAELEAFAKAKEAAMGEKVRPIERLRGELEKQGTVLSKDARKAKEEELDRLQRDAQRFIADAQTEMKKKQESVFSPILKEMRTIIAAIAQQERFSVVLDAASGVVYAEQSLDITQKVISKHNSGR